MKVAFNVMTYLQQAALSASHQIVVGEGSDPDMLLEAWRHVGQLGTLTERFYPLVSMPIEAKGGPLGSYLATTIGIAEKDLDLAVNLGLESGPQNAGCGGCARFDASGVRHADELIRKPNQTRPEQRGTI